MKSTGRNPFQVLRDQWAIMSFYERFEQVEAPESTHDGPFVT